MISLTIIIIILNIAASLYAWNNKDIYSKWMMNPYIVHHDNQYYRFITSGFIHGDWMHLLFNMFSLYFFGENLEYYLMQIAGAAYPLYFLGIYMMAIVVSDLPTYFKYKNDKYYKSLGASGAVSAVIFACILIDPLCTVYPYGIPVKGFIFGFLYLGYSYYAGKKNLGGINHDAHFYGALFGVVAMLIIYPGAGIRFFEEIGGWRLF